MIAMIAFCSWQPSILSLFLLLLHFLWAQLFHRIPEDFIFFVIIFFSSVRFCHSLTGCFWGHLKLLKQHNRFIGTAVQLGPRTVLIWLYKCIYICWHWVWGKEMLSFIRPLADGVNTASQWLLSFFSLALAPGNTKLLKTHGGAILFSLLLLYSYQFMHWIQSGEHVSLVDKTTFLSFFLFS